MNASRKKWNRKTLVQFILGMMILAGVILFLFRLSSSNPDTQTGGNAIPEKLVEVSESEKIEGGVHAATGLIADEGLNAVIAHCTGCHSSKLIIQNRATREGWISVIRWMQETQNLWDLGENEEVIVSYLTKNYAPEGQGRRAPLLDIDWYELKE
jgi:hypothetical protein